MGNYEKQKQLLERVLAINEEHFGLNHPSTAVALGNLANAYENIGSIADAKTYMNRAYQIFLRFPGFGENHPYTKKAFQHLKRLNRIPNNFIRPSNKKEDKVEEIKPCSCFKDINEIDNGQK